MPNTTALPVWPINTDYSTHTSTAPHRHICPTCARVFECIHPLLGQPCQTTEHFGHDRCELEPHPDDTTATAADLASLRAHLMLIAPGYLAESAEAVPTTGE